MKRKKIKNQFPWRSGNHFTLLADSLQFYPAMLQAINNAHTEILIENYLNASGIVFSKFVHAITQAAKRNVQVFILFDDFGSRGINRADREKLDIPNINLLFYNPLHIQKHRHNLFRDHRKIFVIDSQLAFVGGAGLSDQFDATHSSAWHDLMLQIHGPVVQDWHRVFQLNWRHSNSKTLLPQVPPTAMTADTSNLKAGACLGQIITSSALKQQEIKRHFLINLQRSKNIVWLTTPYFYPSWKMRRALLHAARRGVDVRLLLPGTLTDHPSVRLMGQRFYARLLRHGVRIFEFSSQFSHTKAMLCDHWATIGSSNFDRWNFRWNLEANQSIENKEFADKLHHLFQQTQQQCVEIHYDQWRTRSRWQRVKEWFWGKVAYQLGRLRRPRGS